MKAERLVSTGLLQRMKGGLKLLSLSFRPFGPPLDDALACAHDVGDEDACNHVRGWMLIILLLWSIQAKLQNDLMDGS